MQHMRSIFFDWLTIPVAAAALITAVLMIPKARTGLKATSIVIAAFTLLGSIGWVAM